MPAKKIKLYNTVKTVNPKFEKYNGLPQMSYSAYTSWRSDSYRGAFIASKFLGIPDPGSIFTEYGSACGKYLETRGSATPERSPLLSESDVEVLDAVVLPPNSSFEREIMLRRKDYCIIGYIDMCSVSPEGKLEVRDFKTGATKKTAEYASPDYQQTRLYAHALEKEEGEEVGYVGVELLHRKGNNLIPGDKNCLRLEGPVTAVPTPFDRKEIEFFLEGVDKVAEEISDFITFHQKYFAEA